MAMTVTPMLLDLVILSLSCFNLRRSHWRCYGLRLVVSGVGGFPGGLDWPLGRLSGVLLDPGEPMRSRVFGDVTSDTKSHCNGCLGG